MVIVYAIGLTPQFEIMMSVLMNIDDETTIVEFVDNVTGAWKIYSLRKWRNTLLNIGSGFGYAPQPTKS